MNPDIETTEINAEQAADFAALQAMADDAPRASGEPEPEAAPVRLPLDQEIAGMLQMIAGVLQPVLPSVAKIYSPEVCGAVGGAVAPVCVKHGWLQGGIGGKYGEEIMMLVVVAPLAWATMEATKTDIAARQPKREVGTQGIDLDKPVVVPAASAGSNKVIIGSPIPGAA